MAQATSDNLWLWRPDTWLHQRLAEKQNELKDTIKAAERARELSRRASQKPPHDRRNCERCSKSTEGESMGGSLERLTLQSPEYISGSTACSRDSE